MNIRFCAALLLLAGCYSPDLSGVRYTCIDSNAYCPRGLTCIAGLCQAPGSGNQSDLAAPTDAGAASDLPPSGPVDMAWDPAAKPGPAPACKSGKGYQLSPTAYACPAVLANMGDINTVCVSPFTICSQPPVSAAACAAIPWGFYASLSVGWQAPDLLPPVTNVDCSWNLSETNQGTGALFGCGQSSASGAVLAQPSTCGNFATVVGCRNGSMPTSWNCPLLGARPTPNDYPAVTNTDDKSGVLCCR